MPMKRVLIVSFTILLFACTEKSKTNKSITNKDNNKQLSIPSLDIKDGEERVFILPAPMQVVSVLGIVDAPYNENLISAPDNYDKLHSTFDKGINLGVYSIDLAYAIVNSQNQKGQDIFMRLNDLTTSLGISESFDKTMGERLEKNFNDIDSASYLLLSAFEEAHLFFEQNNKEKLGLIIISGAFIEGLHFLLNYPDKGKEPEYYSMLQQQKVYLNNILMLLNRHSEDEQVYTLLQDLIKLENGFQQLNSGLHGAEVNIPPNIINILTELKDINSAIRNKII